MSILKKDISRVAYPIPTPIIRVRFNRTARELFGRTPQPYYIHAIHRVERCRKSGVTTDWLVDLDADVGFGPKSFRKINVLDLEFADTSTKYLSITEMVVDLWKIECQRYR